MPARYSEQERRLFTGFSFRLASDKTEITCSWVVWRLRTLIFISGSAELSFWIACTTPEFQMRWAERTLFMVFTLTFLGDVFLDQNADETKICLISTIMLNRMIQQSLQGMTKHSALVSVSANCSAGTVNGKVGIFTMVEVMIYTSALAGRSRWTEKSECRLKTPALAACKLSAHM